MCLRAGNRACTRKEGINSQWDGSLGRVQKTGWVDWTETIEYLCSLVRAGLSWDCLSTSHIQTSVRVLIMPHRCFFLNFSICFISTFLGRRRDVFCLLRALLCLVKKCKSRRCIFICQNLPVIYQISAWADGLGMHWIFFSFSSLLLICLCFLFCWYMLRFWCFCETLPLSLRLLQLNYSNSAAVQIYVK